MAKNKNCTEKIMGNEKSVLPLQKIEDIKLPFVEGSFVNKDGKSVNGVFLIDSGSNKNVLNFRLLKHLKEDCLVNDKLHIGAFVNTGEDCQKANVKICVGDTCGETEFYVSYNIDFLNIIGAGIIGILGVEFLCQHQWILDFENQCLRHDDNTFDTETFKFFFPMEFGLRNYSIPVVGLVKDDKDFVFIADTGSNMNTMTKFALENAANALGTREERNSVEGLFGKKEMSLVDTSFSLLSIGKKAGDLEMIEDKDVFQILPDDNYIMEFADDERPPIVGLIGTDYMLRNKWVLDFHHGLMYAS